MDENLSTDEKRALVEEAREIFGQEAAREMWAKLGLPEVASMSGALIGNLTRGTQRKWPQFLVRMPPALKAWLAQTAAETGNSINNEILRSIQERMERTSNERPGNPASAK